MTLPNEVKGYIEKIAYPFGGYDEASEYVSKKDFEYLFTFPGFIITVKPWAAQFDLQEYGYLPKQKYHIYDRDFNLIYSEHSEDGYFGSSVDIQNLLEQKHASFLFISFSTDLGPKLGLLWVCNKPSRTLIKTQITKWQLQIAKVLSNYQSNDIILRTDNIDSESVRLYLLPGIWNEKLIPEEVINHPLTTYQDYEIDSSVILINLTRTGWYVFKAGTDILELNNLTGRGLDKLSNNEYAYFFTLDDRGVFLNNSTTYTPNRRVQILGSLNPA
jgi:hypothetical protein